MCLKENILEGLYVLTNLTRLSHFLLLILVPDPQVTLRALQALQPPQPPSNIIGRGGIVVTLNLKCMSIKESLRFGK